jgi:hypothetical protein
MGGASLSSLDKDAYEVLKPHGLQLSPLTHPYVFAWYSLMSRFSPAMMNSFPPASGAAPAKSAPAKAAPAKKGKEAAPKKEDDDLDLFGDDDEADAEAAKKAAAAAKEKAQGAKKKKEVIAMSLVMLEVKPLDDTVDLDVLAKKIIAEIT